jgi:serine protease Do
MTNHRVFKRSMAFILVVMISLIWFGSGNAQTQAKGPTEKTELDQLFKKARESFLRGDFQAAATAIRKGEAFVKQEADRATREAKQSLMTSSEDLRKLADELRKGEIHSVKELDSVFARTHHALARYYQEKASKSWAQKAIMETGRYLRLAAVHLENALAWAEYRIEAGAATAVDEARRLGEKMEQGKEWVASEATKSIDAIRKEVGEAGRKIGLLGLKSSTIRVSNRPVGPVDLITAIIQVAKQNLPSVVYIEVTESREVENPFFSFENDPFFRRFFGVPKMPRKFKQEIKGLGSGIVIDKEGHILTNYHVAGGATKMEVTLADGSKYPAELVGGDPKTDLAVVQIQTKEGLLQVTFGNSDNVVVGEWVVAIGAPRALEKSVTQGIISAKHRTGITDPSSYQDFLQTDAAINPGNSGGPLLNLNGEVVGVNAAIATESGGFEGIGFTIPSNMAVYVAKALIAHGKVERGWLGVTIRNLTPKLAKSARAETSRGALLAEVVKGGPADQAGMKKNDVVIAYGGKDIPDSAMLRNAVAETPVGQEVKLTVLRNGKKKNLTVKIGSLEESIKLLSASAKERLGAEVRLPTVSEVQQYGLSPNQGVVIRWLNPRGPLAEAGFEIGDMILAINGQPVDSVESFVGLVSSLRPNQKISVLALDHRTGNTMTIQVVVP